MPIKQIKDCVVITHGGLSLDELIELIESDFGLDGFEVMDKLNLKSFQPIDCGVMGEDKKSGEMKFHSYDEIFSLTN